MKDKEENMVRQLIKEILEKYYKKERVKRIELLAIQQALPGDIVYLDFAKEIKNLEEEGVLKPIPKYGTNCKPMALYNTYLINLSLLNKQFILEVQDFQKQASPYLDLGVYVKGTKKLWKEDLPWLIQLDSYLKKRGLPIEEATAPERSYYITQDEKWIDEKGGKDLLERIGLYERMKINRYTDPLMLAINYEAWKKAEQSQKKHKHLIVENKSTYYLFLEGLRETDFTTLIYGCGWKISAGLQGIYKQLGLNEEQCLFYYFGDLDYEGIAIYESISERVQLATIFYEALLENESAKGKENQKHREDTLELFVRQFNEENRVRIKKILGNESYYPQEALSKECYLRLWKRL